MFDRNPTMVTCFMLLSLMVASSSAAGYIFNGYRRQPAREDNNMLTIVTNNNRRCVQKAFRDFRPVPGSCTQYQMCSNNILTTLNCPEGMVFNVRATRCIPKGSMFDTCGQDKGLLIIPEIRPQPQVSHLGTVCPRGVTYKKAHPHHCARYYDCGKPAMMGRWEDHEWECKYPLLFNEDSKRCEHYTTVACGSRKIAYDKCEYKANECNGHSHCIPCTVRYPSCRDLPDGMNEWEGRVPSPYYVVCADHRVTFSGTCPEGQIFDGKSGTCVIMPDDRVFAL